MRQSDEIISNQIAGRLAALLFAASGLLTLASLALPEPPEIDRPGIVVVALSALLVGVVAWRLPWDRWPRSASLWLTVPAFTLIAFHNHFGGADPYRYGLFFMVVFVWVGLAQPRWTSIRLAPALVLSYLVPLGTTGRFTPANASSLLYALPIYLLVAETVGWVTASWRRTQADLRQSEARFRAVFEQAGIGVALTDTEGRIVAANPALEEMLGFGRGELAGVAIAEVTEPDDMPRNLELRRRLLGGEVERYQMEKRYRHRGGRLIWGRLTSSVVRDERGTPRFIVGMVEDITARKALEDQIAHQATHDPLTDLPNRTLLLDELAHALARARRHGRQLAVLFLDLDNFKLVNDSLGHETGDRLLVAVAERLRACLRASDIAARLGGDEFTVVLEEVRDPADATRLAERVLEALRGPYAVGAQEVFVTPSIGIVLSRDGEERPEDLLRDADVAMYRAKRRGKARVELFDPRMNQEVQARLQLESDLRRAIECGEFLLHYQPQVQLPAGWIVGFEALLRWRHPRRGLVPPGEFIPIAEETGLIVPLGAWVLEEACRQARAWTDAIPSAADLVVSVNLSSRQFQQPDLVARVRDTLGRTGLSPRNLAIEITESAVMEDVEGAVTTLQALAALGVQLMIDDFGTGYSSLSYLKRFPVQALKIDRSFVDGLGAEIEDTVISSAVVGLARALDLKVIAEGVESAAQVAHLQAMDCDRAQGYLFAPPIPAERVEALLRQQAATGQGIGAGPAPGPPQLRLV